MGYFRFRRRIKLFPGVHWNIGKKSSSLSFGGRGFTHTIGQQGSRTTVGIPGTGLSYTHVQPHSPPASPPPPLPPSSASSQSPHARKLSKVFYTLGWIMLAIWLLNKVFDQNAARSPTSNPSASRSASVDTGTIKERVNQAAKRAEEPGNPMGIRRAVPVEPTVAPAQSPVTTASVDATAPSESPVATPPIPDRITYRVVNVRPNDFLNLRGGPDSGYPVVVRIRAGTREITLGASRVRNESTYWRRISVGPYTGWVNEIYLEAEKPTP
jgi:hypothetical protein